MLSALRSCAAAARQSLFSAARAAAGAGSWFAILLASFVVAPTSGSRPPSPSPRLEAVVLQLKRIGEAQAIAGCTEQQVREARAENWPGMQYFFMLDDIYGGCMEVNR